MNYELLKQKYNKSTRIITVIFVTLVATVIMEPLAGWVLLPRHWIGFGLFSCLSLLTVLLCIFFGGANVLHRFQMRRKFYKEVSKKLRQNRIDPRHFIWVLRFQMSSDLAALAESIVREEREYLAWRNRSPGKNGEELAMHKQLDRALGLIRAEFPRYSREARMLRRMIGNTSVSVQEKSAIGEQMLITLEEAQQKLQQEPPLGQKDTRFEDMLARFQRLAGDNPPKAALRLIEQAKAKSTWKEQRKLLVGAISMLGSIATAEEHLKGNAEQGSENGSNGNVVEIKLNKLAQETFKIEPFFPEDVDAQMAKQILLALMDLGRDAHIVGSNYRPADTVLRLVAKRYKILRKFGMITENYHPTVCVQTLFRLHREGILLSKQKTNEVTYSRCPKPGNARSDWAEAVIREANRFYNTFSK